MMVLCLRRYVCFSFDEAFELTMSNMPFSIVWKLKGAVVGLWQGYLTFSTLKSTSAEMLWLGVFIPRNSLRACTCSHLQGTTCLCQQDEQQGVNMFLGNFNLWWVGGYEAPSVLPTNANSVDKKMYSSWTRHTNLGQFIGTAISPFRKLSNGLWMV